MSSHAHRFGGDWTREKLSRLKAYLQACMTIMKNQPFKVAYIDAFAGTGYSEPASTHDDMDQHLFQQFSEQEPQSLLKGSVINALEVEPPFHHYIFIEQKRAHVQSLEELKHQFPERAARIEIKRGEANEELRILCKKSWASRRAVLFLDPYGMQVEWSTLEAVAKTRSIDLWILFPSGVAVNRMLPRHGDHPPAWKKRLDKIFGSEAWDREFYVTETDEDMLGSRQVTRKVDFPIEKIGNYFTERLRSIFPGVARNPLSLTTPSGRPLYLLCFAAANEKGAKTALKIAQHLLKAE